MGDMVRVGDAVAGLGVQNESIQSKPLTTNSHCVVPAKVPGGVAVGGYSAE